MLHDGAAMSWTSSTPVARRIGPEPISGVLASAVRAGVFATVGTGLAVTGHHLASGQPVPWRAGLLVGGLLFVLALPLVRSARSLPMAFLATVAAQAALHLWFLRFAENEAVHAAHAMAAHDPPHAVHHEGSMTAAHMVAALMVAWCMHRADTASRFVGQLLVEVVGGIVVRLAPAGHVPAVTAVPCPTRPRAHPRRRNSQELEHAVVRRGPPMVPAFPV